MMQIKYKYTCEHKLHTYTLPLSNRGLIQYQIRGIVAPENYWNLNSRNSSGILSLVRLHTIQDGKDI